MSKAYVSGSPSGCYRSRTAFEKSKTDVFRLKTHNVGPLKKLRYALPSQQTVVF